MASLLSNKWFIGAFILSIVLLFLQISRRNTKYEGFTQTEPFVVKRGKDAFDSFYSEIYDKLNKIDERSNEDAMEIIQATQPDKANSYFLDTGCGTGCLVDILLKQGYQATGIDINAAMIETGKERRPSCTNKITAANPMDPMLFDKATFTHILCLNRSFYGNKDKVAFFRNCKHWLRSGGYLVVHLVDSQKFNPIVPLGQPNGILGMEAPKSTSSGKRITDTVIDFVDFKYNSSYDIQDGSKVIQTETFTDSTTNNVRQNEHVWFMEDPKIIIEDAGFCGFIPIGEFVNKTDPGQKTVILKAT